MAETEGFMSVLGFVWERCCSGGRTGVRRVGEAFWT